ncbi:hypothetical protein NMY22_g19109 [Coprinellus aureogranulatus]|nr:hypothetical protein NMY22_g19109 [Coprinellus aureogranulatus]
MESAYWHSAAWARRVHMAKHKPNTEMTKQPSQRPDRGKSNVSCAKQPRWRQDRQHRRPTPGQRIPERSPVGNPAAPRGCNKRSVMNIRELDLTFNPFEDDSPTDERTPQNRQYFGSAFLPNATTPTTRRRSSFGSSNGAPSAIRKRHTRSRTEFDLDIPEPEISGHPLKSAALRSAAFQDFDITRPNLSRIVQSTGVLRRSRSQEPPDSGTRSPAVKEEEKEVIIHEVTSKDSLAGVSLKYGIPLPELRRANQLWASDSIHLRRVLYIPIDRAKRAHEYVAPPSQQSSPASPTADSEALSSHFPIQSRGPSSSTGSPASLTSEVNPRVQKIPVSQLSFFPPSSNPSRTQTPAGTPSPVRAEFSSQRTPYLKASNPTTRTGSGIH